MVHSGNVTITQDQAENVVESVRSAYGADAEEAFTDSQGKPLQLEGPP